MQLSAHETMLS